MNWPATCPRPSGAECLLRCRYLPQLGLDPQSTRYALGPIGYVRGGGLLPPSLVDFNRGAEVITAQYSSREGGDGSLTLIDYPTPQLAAYRARAVAAFLAAGNTAGAQWTTQLAESSPAALQSRRSGPLLAVSSGTFSSDAAHKLISGVNYSADVTWNHPQGYVSEVSKTARLLVGILSLTAILGGTALLLGIFFGGGRAFIVACGASPIRASPTRNSSACICGNDPVERKTVQFIGQGAHLFCLSQEWRGRNTKLRRT